MHDPLLILDVFWAGPVLVIVLPARPVVIQVHREKPGKKDLRYIQKRLARLSS